MPLFGLQDLHPALSPHRAQVVASKLGPPLTVNRLQITWVTTRMSFSHHHSFWQQHEQLHQSITMNTQRQNRQQKGPDQHHHHTTFVKGGQFRHENETCLVSCAQLSGTYLDSQQTFENPSNPQQP